MTQEVHDPAVRSWLRTTESPRLSQGPQDGVCEAPVWRTACPVPTRLGTFERAGQYVCATELHLAKSLVAAAAKQTPSAYRLRAVQSIAQQWAEVWTDILCLEQASVLDVYLHLFYHGEHLENALYEALGAYTYAEKCLALSCASTYIYANSAIYREE